MEQVQSGIKTGRLPGNGAAVTFNSNGSLEVYDSGERLTVSDVAPPDAEDLKREADDHEDLGSLDFPGSLSVTPRVSSVSTMCAEKSGARQRDSNGRMYWTEDEKRVLRYYYIGFAEHGRLGVLVSLWPRMFGYERRVREFVCKACRLKKEGKLLPPAHRSVV